MKKPTHVAVSHAPTEAEIQKAAYHLWMEGGCREGVELENWFAAKELLQHHHGRDGGRVKHHPAPSIQLVS